MNAQLGTRKKIVYGLLLAGAVTGLLIDRMHPRRGPAAARADAPSALVARTQPALADPGPPLAAIFEKQLSSASTAASGAASRDGFAVTDALRRACAPQDALPGRAEGAGGAAAEAAQTAEAFRTNHVLKGTVLRGGRAWALVDDRVLTPGDELDGFRLESVEDYRAVFIRGRQRVILELPRPGES